MGRAEPRVVVDANVLANIHVCDLLLRLAEEPALFLPLWSHAVLDEVQKTHQKLGWSLEISDYWRSEVQKAFPESLVTGWEHLIDQIQVDPKDRHVVAAAVRAEATLIVTFNLKHFPAEGLIPWGLEVMHPAAFLLEFHERHPEIIHQRLEEYARRRKCTKPELVSRLGQWLKPFADVVGDKP
jgi:predicted nucleic acid-binding protein